VSFISSMSLKSGVSAQKNIMVVVALSEKHFTFVKGSPFSFPYHVLHGYGSLSLSLGLLL
jgi:hypothetical protein